MSRTTSNQMISRGDRQREKKEIAELGLERAALDARKKALAKEQITLSQKCQRFGSVDQFDVDEDGEVFGRIGELWFVIGDGGRDGRLHLRAECPTCHAPTRLPAFDLASLGLALETGNEVCYRCDKGKRKRRSLLKQVA